MTDKLQAFYEKLSADEEMVKELEAIAMEVEPEDQISATIKFAKEKGFELTEEDFAFDEDDVSLDELANVAGGGGCGCMIIGGGGGDGLQCDCRFLGKGFVKGYSRISSQGGCICGGPGAGATRRH